MATEQSTAVRTVPPPITQESMMALMGASQSPALMIFLNDALFARCKEVANIMAAADGVTPAHLIGKPHACFSVVSMSLIWKLAPTMVAGSTFTVGNKLGYEGKLIQAILENSGRIIGTPKPEYFGPWEKVLGKFTKKKNDKGKEYAVPAWKDEDEEGIGVVVRAQVEGEAEPREFSFLLKQAFPRNSTIWATDPKTQLWYTAVRRFANVAAPGILMGVPFDREETMAMGDVIEVTAEEAAAVSNARPKRPSRAAAKSAAAEMDEEFKSAVGPKPEETVIEETDDGVVEQTGVSREVSDEPTRAGTKSSVPVAHDPETGEIQEDDFAQPAAEDDDVSVPAEEEPAPPAKEPPKPAPAPAPKPQEAPKPAAQPKAAPPAEEPQEPAQAAQAPVSEAKAKEIQAQAERGFQNAMTLARLDEVKESMMKQIGTLKAPFKDRYDKIVAAYKTRAAYLKSRTEDDQ